MYLNSQRMGISCVRVCSEVLGVFKDFFSRR
jgi:hypothetical protein